MNFEYDKNNYKELIISERITQHNDPELWERVKSFVSSYDDIHAVACREIGDEKQKWHTHIFIQRNPFKYKKTTFRSQIQKIFGKSNTRWDWKLRDIKKTSTVLQCFKYVTKNSDLIIAHGANSREMFEQYKGKYEPFDPRNRTLIQDLRNNITRCDICKDGNIEYCLEDCLETVIQYFDNNNKVYDLYRMKNLAHTLYYKSNREELKDRLRQMIYN